MIVHTYSICDSNISKKPVPLILRLQNIHKISDDLKKSLHMLGHKKKTAARRSYNKAVI